MARSGSFNTSGYTDDYGTGYLVFSWSIKEQDAAKNQTVINWSLKGAGITGNYYYKSGNFKVVINGATVYSSSTRIELKTGTTVASGTATITHAADGTKKFSASAEAGIYYSAVNCSGDGSWTLDPIPRYATITQSLKSKTETSITMNWSSDSTIDYLWYSTNNGGSWTGINVTDGKSGSYTINGLSAETDYQVKTRVRRKDSQLTTDSSAFTVQTHGYPACIGAQDFTIGDPVELNFYNPLGREFTFNIIANGVRLTYDWTVSGKKYTGLYAEGVQTQLYNSIPNDPHGTYMVVVTYAGHEQVYNGRNKYFVNEQESAPTSCRLDYADINEVTRGVTGDVQALVKGYSNLLVSFRGQYVPTARNGASMVSCVFSVDTLSQTVPYTSGDLSVSLGAIHSAGVKRLSCRAYDSRGLSSLSYVDITVYEYDKPVVNAEIKRLNNFEAQTTLKISGEYSPVMINGQQKNWPDEVGYRYRETGGAWINPDWDLVGYNSGGDTFTCDDIILSLDISKSYEFEIYVTDDIDESTVVAHVDIGQAIFFISSNQKACFINGQKIIMYDVVETWGGW